MFRRATVSALQHLKRANLKNPQLLQFHRPAWNCLAFVRNESMGSRNLDTIWAGSSENVAQSQAVEHLDWSPSMEATGETIVEPPAMPELPSIVQVVHSAANGEPTLASLGLGSESPAGLVQQGLEILHCNVGLPWWGAIALANVLNGWEENVLIEFLVLGLTGTVIMRAAMFPLVLKSQRAAANIHNNLPQIQVFRMKITEASNAGNEQIEAKYARQMVEFMEAKGINPFHKVLVPVAMGPIYLSYFVGLMGMVNLPVESMKTGGMLWFTDLTMPDPLSILPLMTSVVVWATLKFGADDARLATRSPSLIRKYVIITIPAVIFAFSGNLPAALLCWCATTSAISLAQVAAFKLPKVRKFFNIDTLIVHPPEDLPMSQKKVVMKANKDHMKISKEMDQRQRYDEKWFGPTRRGPKIYKYDPTKASGAVQAQKK